MSIKIKEIAFVFSPITDVARSRKFYEGVLGLKASLSVELAPGKWWIEYDIAGVSLAVSNAMGAHQGAGSGVTLEVVSLDDTLAAIRAAKVPISKDVMEFPPCRMFAVKDPDGNEIGFHQLKKK